MANITIVMIFLVIIPGTILTGLCCILQGWLSKQETRWYGWVLPSVHIFTTFLLIMAIFTVSIFSDVSVGAGSNYVDEENHYVVDQIETNVSMGECLTLMGAFFLLNLPTGVYLLIYRYTKRNLSKFEELTRMTVLDLE